MPAGMPLTLEDIHADSIRRKMGYGRGNRMKIETDDVKILAGVRRGETLAARSRSTSKTAIIRSGSILWRSNRAKGGCARGLHSPPGTHRSRRRPEIRRPDMRDILERASARETAMRVALGAIARRLLAELGISVASRVVRIGEVVDETPLDADIATLNARVDESPVRVLDPHAAERIVQQIDTAREAGDTLGGVFEVVAGGLPIGLGSHASGTGASMVGSAKPFLRSTRSRASSWDSDSVVRRCRVSAVHDAYFPGENGELTRYGSNRAGGIEGGISTGQPIVVRVAMKPISTLMKPLPSVDLRSGRGDERVHRAQRRMCGAGGSRDRRIAARTRARRRRPRDVSGRHDRDACATTSAPGGRKSVPADPVRQHSCFAVPAGSG